MSDKFSKQFKNLESPVDNGIAVTASDSVDLSISSRALFIGTGGNLRVTLTGMTDGTYLNFTNIAAGWHPIRAKRVWTTGTTASNILALH